MNQFYFKRRFAKQLQELKVYNLTQVAAYLEVSERTIYNYVQRHGLPKHRGKGTGMNGYYVKKEVDEWVEKNPHIIFKI